MGCPQHRKWLSIDWRCTSCELILRYFPLLLSGCLPPPPPPPSPSPTLLSTPFLDHVTLRLRTLDRFGPNIISDGNCWVGHAGIQITFCCVHLLKPNTFIYSPYTDGDVGWKCVLVCIYRSAIEKIQSKGVDLYLFLIVCLSVAVLDVDPPQCSNH